MTICSLHQLRSIVHIYICCLIRRLRTPRPSFIRCLTRLDWDAAEHIRQQYKRAETDTPWAEPERRNADDFAVESSGSNPWAIPTGCPTGPIYLAKA